MIAIVRVCRHCGRQIQGQGYFVAGYETAGNGVPENVYVHDECRTGFDVAQSRKEQLRPVTAREV